MTREQEITVLVIQDLALARLRNPPLDPNVEHDLMEILRLTRLITEPEPAPSADGPPGEG